MFFVVQNKWILKWIGFWLSPKSLQLMVSTRASGKVLGQWKPLFTVVCGHVVQCQWCSSTQGCLERDGAADQNACGAGASEGIKLKFCVDMRTHLVHMLMKFQTDRTSDAGDNGFGTRGSDMKSCCLKQNLLRNKPGGGRQNACVSAANDPITMDGSVMLLKVRPVHPESRIKISSPTWLLQLL